jgi:hypothetical protein
MCSKFQRGKIEFNAACDIYSFGVVLAELWSGHLQNSSRRGEASFNFPDDYYDDDDEDFDLDKMLKDIDPNIRPDDEEDTDLPRYMVKFAELTEECLEEKPKRRPNGTKILRELRSIHDECERDQQHSTVQVDVKDTSLLVESVCRNCKSPSKECANLDGIPFSICKDCIEEDANFAALGHLTRMIHDLRESVDQNHETMLSSIEQKHEENMRAHRITQQEVVKTSKAVSKLCCKVMKTRCPRLFVLVDSSVKDIRKVPLAATKSWFLRKGLRSYNLSFFCEYSGELVDAPVKIRVGRDWLQKAAPYIIFSMKALAVCGKVATGIDLDFTDYVRSGGLTDPNFSEMCENLVDSANMLIPGSQSLDDQDKISDDVVDLIEEKAEENRLWAQKMTRILAGGKYFWVKTDYRVEAEEHFQREQEQAGEAVPEP